jgi:hypothetical protein
LGSITLPNRIIMAPLTRMRAGAGNIPTAVIQIDGSEHRWLRTEARRADHQG